MSTPVDPQEAKYTGKVEQPSGKQFDLANPKWDIHDIAYSLSYIPRFNGKLKKFVSVAEHSVLCSLMMRDKGWGNPLEGLLHDAHESIIGDLAAPIKYGLGPEFRKLDKHLETSLRQQFGLPVQKSDECIKVDWLSMFIEAYLGMPSRGQEFEDPNGYRVQALQMIEREGWRTVNMTPEVARAAFMVEYKRYAAPAVVSHRDARVAGR